MTKEEERMQGSLLNRLAERTPFTPVVGDGVTIYFYSDRNAATIIRVLKSGRVFLAQEDHAERVDSNGVSEDQSYAYTRDLRGFIHRFFFSEAKGCWISRGAAGVVAGRHSYYDYGF